MSNQNNDLTLTLLSLALKGLSPEQLTKVLPKEVTLSVDEGALADVDPQALATALREHGWEALEDLCDADPEDLAAALRDHGWEAVGEYGSDACRDMDPITLAESLADDHGWAVVSEDALEAAVQLTRLGWICEDSEEGAARVLRERLWIVGQTPKEVATYLQQDHDYLVGSREVVIEKLEAADYIVLGGPCVDLRDRAAKLLDTIPDDLLLAEVARRMKEGA